jgi:hypothetical protein
MRCSFKMDFLAVFESLTVGYSARKESREREQHKRIR